MTQYLPRLLELGFHPDNARKHEIINSFPKEYTIWHEGKAVPVRELLQSEGVAGTNVVQTEVLRTVIEGAEPAKCMRNILPMFRVASNALNIPLSETGTYAQEVAEGAEIPIDTITLSKAAYTIKKYGVRPAITKEMIEDALVDMVALEVAKAGQRLENILNQASLSAVLEASGQSHDTAGSAGNQGIKAIVQAFAKVSGQGFLPNAVVMHPAAQGILMLDYTQVAAYFPVGSVPTSGQLPPILGMKSGVYGGTDTSPTYNWGYSADNDIGFLVMDAPAAGGIAMRRDITVEEYDDPIRDLKGMACTMRFGVQYHMANSICRILY